MSRALIITLAAAATALTSGAAFAGTSIPDLPIIQLLPFPIDPIVNTPEPASLLLLATGVAGAAAIKRFRRRR